MYILCHQFGRKKEEEVGEDDTPLSFEDFLAGNESFANDNDRETSERTEPPGNHLDCFDGCFCEK